MRRRDDGYVAADALSALAILGLAVGGLTMGLFTIGRGEFATTSTVTEAVSLRRAGDELGRMLSEQGPFRSDAADGEGLAGDADELAFPCGEGRCAARVAPGRMQVTDAAGVTRVLRLPGVAAPRFAYVGSTSAAASWPTPVPPPPAPRWQTLQAVVVEESATGRPLFVGRLAVQQTFDCEFDAIIQDCRKPAS